jgi:hypothetical protein
MKLVPFFLLLAVAAVTVGSGPAASQQGNLPQTTPVTRLVECRKIADPAQRLQCYDAGVDSLNAAVKGGSIVVVDREDVRKTRRSLFGFTLPKLPFFKGDNSQEDTPDTIEAVIKSVKNLPNDKYLIELDSGAVWQTLQEASLQMTPKSGQKIRITGGALGSYRLSVAGRPALRAMRIR